MEHAAEMKQPESASASNVNSSSKINQPVSSSRSICTKDDAMKAEILWCFRTVVTHASYKSNETCNVLFRKMFPDSSIAVNFQCGERKTAYMASFGIAPYLRDNMKNLITDEQYYVLLFDESMNKPLQEKQLDFHIRIWNGDSVSTHYYASEFLGHARADDLLQSFTTVTKGLPMKGLLQLAMDGPSVNWKFHQSVQDELHRRQDCHGISLINVGSCGLHVVHNAFKLGIESTGWKIEYVLQCLRQIFKDTPARRDDFCKAVGEKEPLYGLKYCKTRWVENIPVIERALLILPNVAKYAKAVSEGKYPDPGTKSFEAVKEALKDHLFVPRLQFMLSVAKQVTPFLLLYQTEKPVLAFMCGDLYELLKSLMARFVKKEKMEEIKSVEKIIKVKVSDKELHVPYNQVDIGFVAEKLSKELLAKKSVNEKHILEFRMESKTCLQTVVEKLLEKSPIQYVLTRKLTCLDPRKMINKSSCKQKMKDLLECLVEVRRVDESECDEIVREYCDFVDEYGTSPEFKNFDPSHGRLDILLYERMSKTKKFAKLWNVCRILLLLSHGQAAVERGFSVNRQIEVENMNAETYSAQRIICDHVSSVGGLNNVVMSKGMMTSVAAARQRYMMSLDDKKREKSKETIGEKRKNIMDEIENLKKKKIQLEVDSVSMQKDADDLAMKAESSAKLTLIAKSNALRRSSKEKILQLSEVTTKLEAKLLELKNY